MSRSQRPNIIWITLDSIRQDHTPMSGYRRDTTPNLRKIASLSDGEAFANCFAAAKWSLASTASMHTGTYPGYHRTGFETNVLPDHVETVAEVLNEAGYHTAGVSANQYFAEATGLNRGFDRFQQIDARNFAYAAGPTAFLRFLAKLNRHSAGPTLEPVKHRPDYLANELTKRYVSDAAEGDEPFFVAAHYHGAHVPYFPPLARQGEFADDLPMSAREGAEIAFERTTDIYRQIGLSHTFADEEWDAINAMYDALVKYSDALMGDLFMHVHGLDLDDTVFVVTADHGDMLGEYGLLGHKLALHDGLTHVPMVVYGSEELLGRGDELVQHHDIMQTLVAMGGGDTDQFQGVDLREGSREFAVSQRGPNGDKGLELIREHNPDFDATFLHESALTAVRTTEFKYQRSADGSNLFELPDETVDVSKEYPETAGELDDVLDGWGAEFEGDSVEAREADFSESTKKQLADLGYVVD